MSTPAFSTRNLPGSDDILRAVLSNGPTLLARENPASPAVIFRGYIPGGSILVEPDQAGLAAFYAGMLMAGTKRLAFKDLHDKIESLGASLSIAAGSLTTSFSGQCLREDLPTLLNLLREIFTEPAFPEKQFKRIKAQTLTILDLQSQDTGYMASQAFDTLLYGNHPFALPEMGFLQSVEAFSIPDLQALHQRMLGPKGMVIAVVGGIAPEAALSELEKTFGDWQNPDQAEMPSIDDVPMPAQTLREHLPLEEKAQTDLMIGTLAPETMGPDYHASTLGDNILGRFGMAGRLGEVVREQAGLAYGIYSSIGTGLGPSAWRVIAGVNPDNLEKAIDLILAELRRFVNEPVSASELEDSRAQIIGRLPLSVESNSGVAQTLLSIQRYGLSLDYLRELPGLLQAISPEDILHSAQRYWHPDALVITSSGRAI